MRRAHVFSSFLLTGFACATALVSAPRAPVLQDARRLSAIPISVSEGGNQQTLSIGDIGKQCIPFAEVRRDDILDCRVSQSGAFASVGELTYHYALYCLIPQYASEPAKCGDGSFTSRYHSQRALAIFIQAGSNPRAQLLLERASSDIGILTYEKPEMIQTAAGTVLDVSIAFDGTGHFNGSEYYLLSDDAWEPIEADTWIADLLTRVPTGLAIWKGVWPDLRSMNAVAGLYRAGDGNCCPTGGAVHIKLAIRSRQIVIDSVVVEPAADAK